MHRSSRAPVLSATRSRASCWITGVPPSRSCSLAAKSKPCKDAGSGRSRRLRSRLRTPQGAALQWIRECEMGGRGPSLSRGAVLAAAQVEAVRRQRLLDLFDRLLAEVRDRSELVFGLR